MQNQFEHNHGCVTLLFFEFFSRGGASCGGWGVTGVSALHLAAEVGHLETVQALVEAKATVNAKNGYCACCVAVCLSPLRPSAARRCRLIERGSGHRAHCL